MRETVLITGAHDLMARHLAPRLEGDYHVKLLSTHPDALFMYHWDVETGQVEPEALTNVDHIIHLAGAKFYDGKPMTDERKAISRNSRVGAAYLLLNKLKENGQRLKSFISSSAAGYYDFDSGILLIDENGPKGNNGNADLCEEWESAADEFRKQQVADRVVKFRNSAVLAPDGGLLQQFQSLLQTDPSLLVKQRHDTYLPWVHLDDMLEMLSAAVKYGHYEGVYNNAADEPVTMATFIDRMTGIWNHDPSLKIVPPYTGVRISSDRLKAAGFDFKFRNLKTALTNIAQSREA